MAMTKSNGMDAEDLALRREPLEAAVAASLKAEEDILKGIGGMDEAEAAPRKLNLADEMLNLASFHLALDGVSRSAGGSRDEAALNNARKVLNRGIGYLEEVVSSGVDVAFSDYGDRLRAIASVTPAERYFLVRKIGLSIDLVANTFADSSRWKWTFVELRGRFVAVAKNLIDLDKVVAYSDPRSPHYEPTVFHLRLVKKLLTLSAEKYREKYELSSKSTDDFGRSLTFLSALRRLCMLTDDNEKAEATRKKIDIWNSKLQADEKKRAGAG